MVKKHVECGETLTEEQFINNDSVYIKENETLFCLKGLYASSLIKDQWVTTISNLQFPNSTPVLNLHTASARLGRQVHGHIHLQ